MIGAHFETEIGLLHVRSTDRSDGSFALSESASSLDTRRARVLGDDGRSWVALRQVHGTAVFDPTLHVVGPRPPEADAAVGFDSSHALAVLTADCAPLVLVGSTGFAMVHAGWRGALDGVIDRAAEALRARGVDPVATYLGPCIQPERYEFGPSELALMAEEFGAEVVASTSSGRPALDLTRAVQLACERVGWPAPARPTCTSHPGFFSHRTRGDLGRQTTVAWIGRPPSARLTGSTARSGGVDAP